ncbi:hypothetical protein J4E08_17035 [Sagittula sp. NFXS13]|uniref:hypothetical protein n=1 Tax=Sagittula sp. NFXS13 TaxID=2819095 RepID=UPI0032DFF47D
MRRLWIWGRRAGIVALLLVAGLLAPVVWVETMCRGRGVPSPYSALLPPSAYRLESRTLLTYPEWHIVHAYDDYAEVIRTGDPHEFGYVQSVAGFWSSLCVLNETASTVGDVDFATKQMVFVIGVSFTAELMLKAAYEETIGRLFAWQRGAERAPLDDLSAAQAAEYAEFLQQVPWYQWDFRQDAEALRQSATDVLRDRERRFALGLEYGAKAAYADLIAQAVAATGFDELRLRMVVSGKPAEDLAAYDAVQLIETIPEGIVIETPRYRALTHLLEAMAQDGWQFREIAGNDDILFTVLSDHPTHQDAIASFPRQGYGDFRHLVMVKVSALSDQLQNLQVSGARLEHVHDY